MRENEAEKQDTDLSEKVDWMLTYFSELDIEVLRFIKKDDPEVQSALDVLEALRSDPKRIWLAELREKKRLDIRSMLEGAREEGRAEGREQARLERLLAEKEEGR